MSNLTELFQLKFLKKVENIHHFECNINEQHPILFGHFPGMPIVPGVCLLNAVKRAVNEITGKETSFLKIRECKFLSAINPTENTRFTMSFILSDENEINAALFVGETQCLKLKATVVY